MKQTCDTCNNELNITRELNTLNCIYCGVTKPASTQKAHVKLAASDIENETDKS